ncbi:hypothetical protein H8K35_15830 [Undibacterium sp. LX40W]|uniref:DUF6969 domain-containing protein n=1 Tax=Undibacterium nitidum TaxID=2762298 RepID=A0A923HWV5_9BURK|nr:MULTISPECIES: hypothetical protein [Undibacterium]MBC3882864.1 hypothetical protein [Undibacterium nitidum]MBC3893145.1 hypothetical protein [Undibacterium sp. LX40W]
MRLPVLVKPQSLVTQSTTPTEKARLWKAANELVSHLHQLSEKGSQVVQQVLGKHAFVEWDHYPEDDVRDHQHHSQYFYHAHPGQQRPFVEHGHFHLFVHAQELGLRPVRELYSEAPAHLIAVSMDATGMPIGFFVVNRWVTKGPWLSSQQCEIALDHFAIKGKQGNRQVNTILSSLVRLYRQAILDLIEERDRTMVKISKGRDRRSVFADQTIEVICYRPISLADDIQLLEEN